MHGSLLQWATEQAITDNNMQHVFLIPALNLNMLARASICPGTSTLIGNLITSFKYTETKPPANAGALSTAAVQIAAS